MQSRRGASGWSACPARTGSETGAENHLPAATAVRCGPRVAATAQFYQAFSKRRPARVPGAGSGSSSFTLRGRRQGAPAGPPQNRREPSPRNRREASPRNRRAPSRQLVRSMVRITKPRKTPFGAHFNCARGRECALKFQVHRRIQVRHLGGPAAPSELKWGKPRKQTDVRLRSRFPPL